MNKYKYKYKYKYIIDLTGSIDDSSESDMELGKQNFKTLKELLDTTSHMIADKYQEYTSPNTMEISNRLKAFKYSYQKVLADSPSSNIPFSVLHSCLRDQQLLPDDSIISKKYYFPLNITLLPSLPLPPLYITSFPPSPFPSSFPPSFPPSPSFSSFFPFLSSLFSSLPPLSPPLSPPPPFTLLPSLPLPPPLHYFL